MSRLVVAAVFVLSFCVQAAHGQMFPERRHIRAGNRAYEKQDYGVSEGGYRSALEKNPASFEAAFNLGDALFRQQRWDEAAEVFRGLAGRADLSASQLASAWYNLGNSLFAAQKLPEALEAYKSSLRANPDDLQAKFNYAYTKKLLEQNRRNQNYSPDGRDNRGGRDRNEGRDPRGGQDENGSENRDGGDSGDGSEDEKDGGPDGDNRPPDKPQPSRTPRSTIGRDEADRILQAVQQQEDNTREKVEAGKAAAAGKSGKNW